MLLSSIIGLICMIIGLLLLTGLLLSQDTRIGVVLLIVGLLLFFVL